jgi:hypothetical protein
MTINQNLPERYGILNTFVDWWGGVSNNPWDDLAACSKASGGASSGSIYDACVRNKAIDVRAIQAIDPTGASAYEQVTSGDVVGLVTPQFVLDAGVPSWVFWTGIGLVGFSLIKGLGR